MANRHNRNPYNTFRFSLYDLVCSRLFSYARMFSLYVLLTWKEMVPFMLLYNTTYRQRNFEMIMYKIDRTAFECLLKFANQAKYKVTMDVNSWFVTPFGKHYIVKATGL